MDYDQFKREAAKRDRLHHGLLVVGLVVIALVGIAARLAWWAFLLYVAQRYLQGS